MFATNSDKQLVSAVPYTWDTNDYVREWELGVEYTFPAAGYTTSSPGYATTVYSFVDVSASNFLTTDFTISGLATLGQEDRDESFEEEYLLHNPITPQKIRHTGFALTSLSL